MVITRQWIHGAWTSLHHPLQQRLHIVSLHYFTEPNLESSASMCQHSHHSEEPEMLLWLLCLDHWVLCSTFCVNNHLIYCLKTRFISIIWFDKLDYFQNLISLELDWIKRWPISTKLRLNILCFLFVPVFSVYVCLCTLQWGPQWRTRGCRAGGAEAPRGDTTPHLSVPPDCRHSPERSLRPAAVHPGLLPHSPGTSRVICPRVPRCTPGPQPLDQLPSAPRAQWPHPAFWLAFHPTHQPVRADRSFWRWGVSGGGAASGGPADGDPLSAVAAAAGGLEGGSSEGTCHGQDVYTAQNHNLAFNLLVICTVYSISYP